MDELLLDAKNLDFKYHLGHQTIHALKDVNLKINKQDFICLYGPSGSGKSTLLNVLGLVENIQEGDLLFKGDSIKNISENKKNRLRKFNFGFVFQSFHLNPVLTAYENVDFFLSRQKIPVKERQRIVWESLKSVGLEEFADTKPLQLSGGQRQRVAIARALAKKPEVIIADEPTASLDQKTGEEIMNLFIDLNLKHKVSIILASHDQMVIEKSPIKISLKDGMISREKLC